MKFENMFDINVELLIKNEKRNHKYLTTILARLICELINDYLKFN